MFLQASVCACSREVRDPRGEKRFRTQPQGPQAAGAGSHKEPSPRGVRRVRRPARRPLNLAAALRGSSPGSAGLRADVEMPQGHQAASQLLVVVVNGSQLRSAGQRACWEIAPDRDAPGHPRPYRRRLKSPFPAFHDLQSVFIFCLSFFLKKTFPH